MKKKIMLIVLCLVLVISSMLLLCACNKNEPLTIDNLSEKISGGFRLTTEKVDSKEHNGETWYWQITEWGANGKYVDSRCENKPSFNALEEPLVKSYGYYKKDNKIRGYNIANTNSENKMVAYLNSDFESEKDLYENYMRMPYSLYFTEPILITALSKETLALNEQGFYELDMKKVKQVLTNRFLTEDDLYYSYMGGMCSYDEAIASRTIEKVENNLEMNMIYSLSDLNISMNLEEMRIKLVDDKVEIYSEYEATEGTKIMKRAEIEFIKEVTKPNLSKYEIVK